MSAAGLTSWAELGLVVSIAAFLGIGIYVAFSRSSTRWDRLRHLPLERDR